MRKVLIACAIASLCGACSADESDGGGAPGAGQGGAGQAGTSSPNDPPGGAGSGGAVRAGSGGAVRAGSGGAGGAVAIAGAGAGNGSGTAGSAGSAGATGGTGGQAGSADPGGGDGFYHMEKLDRGLVAVADDLGVYLGWRMFGYEYEPGQDDAFSFHVYRDGAMVAEVKDSTNYRDIGAGGSSRYEVRAVAGGVERATTESVIPQSQPYVRVPLQRPSSTYSANDASAADLDGDGRYEIVLKWDPADAKDNSQAGVTSNVFIDALKLDGTRMWRIDLGPNIRAGAHYTQFIVYDLDGDGKAEMAVKTAPGTKDGSGSFLVKGPAAGDDDARVYRNGDGYVLSGPEYLTVFDGEDGRELATVAFDVARGTVSAWGDDYGNRVDRFLAAAAYLDDTGLPSVVMARGYYTRSTLTAWNFRDGALTQLWKFDSNTTPRDGANNPYAGQGTHSLSVANIDADPQQEIIYGAMAIDHDGKGKCSTGFGHADALHVSDFVPSRPGLEVFMPNEDGDHPAYSIRDANTCAILEQGPVNGNDTGRAVAADVFDGNPGAEMWAAGIDGMLSASTGDRLGGTPASTNFVIWWDGDESRELEDKTQITKYDGSETYLSCPECASNNGTKATPALTADLLGDWREEVIWREADNSALRIYTTTVVTKRRIYTLMHDPQYRVAIAWQNVAYNQPPHPSFHIGSGMAAPPKPNIRVR